MLAIFQVSGEEDICPNYYTFPKMIGGYNNHTFASHMDYNAATDLIAVVGYTYDTDICGCQYVACGFLWVYYASTMSLKWASIFPEDQVSDT